MNITGNIISGQVMGDTARHLSERFGKIMQERESLSVNRTDTYISRSRQLEYAQFLSPRYEHSPRALLWVWWPTIRIAGWN